LGLDLEPLAGHFHAGLDFQRHAIVADIEEGRLGKKCRRRNPEED